MLYELIANDAAQLLITTELAKECNGCATGCVLEVNGVAEVHGKAKAVDSEIEPLAEALPGGCLLLVTGQENEQNIEDVSISNG